MSDSKYLTWEYITRAVTIITAVGVLSTVWTQFDFFSKIESTVEKSEFILPITIRKATTTSWSTDNRDAIRKILTDSNGRINYDYANRINAHMDSVSAHPELDTFINYSNISYTLNIENKTSKPVEGLIIDGVGKGLYMLTNQDNKKVEGFYEGSIPLDVLRGYNKVMIQVITEGYLESGDIKINFKDGATKPIPIQKTTGIFDLITSTSGISSIIQTLLAGMLLYSGYSIIIFFTRRNNTA